MNWTRSQSGLRKMKRELLAMVKTEDERTITLETETGNKKPKILSGIERRKWRKSVIQWTWRYQGSFQNAGSMMA